MNSTTADRNMLLGILAMQLDFISRDNLILAASLWIRDKSKSLDQIFLNQQMLSAEEHSLLTAVVNKHVENHGSDARASLAAIGQLDSVVRQDLEQLDDQEVRDSLINVSVQDVEADPYATQNSSTLRSRPGRSSFQIPQPQSDPYATQPEWTPQPGRGTTRFQILRPHARGGLGEVFVARDGELNRDVALKEIQRGKAFDAESQNRFVLEAEITGRLEHPGIVPVYSLGSHADGRPFYAMRFIRGRSMQEAIRSYHQSNSSAAEKNLEFRELLGRFIDVCDAISYAHSRGVLHRDLKPCNIMLGQYGETLVVDWGLAKPMAATDSDTAAVDSESILKPLSGSQSGSSGTMHGQAVGTPGYMSPEQATGRLDLLGPVTDVYSMGATLYQILVGQQSQPKRDLGTTLRNIAEGRFPKPREVNSAVPKELEAICLKAMARNPDDRYESVNDLAKDVERWLADEPVSAWREPLLVQVRRWMRRHATLATATATIVLAALVGLTMFTSIVSKQKQALAEKNISLNVAQAELRAQKSELEVKNLSLEQTQRIVDVKNAELLKKNDELIAAELNARTEAETAKSVSEFLVGILEETDPVALSGRMFAGSKSSSARTIRDVVQVGTDQLDVAFQQQDKTRAMLLHTLGNVWLSYGDVDQAGEMLEESREIREGLYPSGNKDRMASIHSAGRVACRQGRFVESARLFGQALEECRELLLQTDNEKERRWLEKLLSDTLWDLGIQVAGYGDAGNLDGVKLLEESLQIRRRLFGEDSRQACMSLFALAQAEIILRDNKLQGMLYLQQALSILDKIKGGSQFETAASYLLQAQMMRKLGQLTGAETAYRNCVEMMQEALGEAHIGVTFVRRQLAQFLLYESDEFAAAHREWSRVQEDYEKMFGANSALVAQSDLYLSRCSRGAMDYGQAKRHGRHGIDIYRALLDEDPENVLQSDLTDFATILDVWVHVHHLETQQVIKRDGIQLGAAWHEEEQAHAKVVEYLKPFTNSGNEKVDTIHEVSLRQVPRLKEYRVQWDDYALGNWDNLQDAELKTRRPALELRGRLLSQQGDVEGASQAAETLINLGDSTSAQLRSAAEVLCQCAATFAEHGPAETDAKETSSRIEHLKSMALDALSKLAELGEVNMKSLETDNRFKVLHDLAEFRALCGGKPN